MPSKVKGTKRAADSSNAKKDGKRRRKAKTDGFKTYNFKVLKQVHPDTGISKRGMAVMDGLTKNALDGLFSQAMALAQSTGRKTITYRDIQAAVRLMLPGELAKHAVSEGTKAMAKFHASK